MKQFVILTLVSLTLAGCGKGRSNNPFRALATAKKAPELLGSYQSQCLGSRKSWLSNLISLAKGNNTHSLPSSERTIISFQGEDATFKEVHYLGAKCDGGEAYAFTEKGTFKVGDKSKNERNNAGRHLDVSMNTVEASVLSEAGANFANSYGLCGRKDWNHNDAAKDVTNVADRGDCYDVTPRRSIANVYQVSDKGLELGYAGDKAVPADDRPISMSASKTFEAK